jgi:hypothetical protein
MQAAKLYDKFESVEAYRLGRLIEDQRQLIEESNQRGYDATSAQIVFESLLISFSLCAQSQQRQRAA